MRTAIFEPPNCAPMNRSLFLVIVWAVTCCAPPTYSCVKNKLLTKLNITSQRVRGKHTELPLTTGIWWCKWNEPVFGNGHQGFLSHVQSIRGHVQIMRNLWGACIKGAKVVKEIRSYWISLHSACVYLFFNFLVSMFKFMTYWDYWITSLCREFLLLVLPFCQVLISGLSEPDEVHFVWSEFLVSTMSPQAHQGEPWFYGPHELGEVYTGVCVCVCVCVCVVTVWCSGCVFGWGPEVLEFKPHSGNFSI